MMNRCMYEMKLMLQTNFVSITKSIFDSYMHARCLYAYMQINNNILINDVGRGHTLLLAYVSATSLNPL